MDNQNPYGGGGGGAGGYGGGGYGAPPGGGGYGAPPGGGGYGAPPGGGGYGAPPGGGGYGPSGYGPTTGTLEVGDVLSTTFRTIGAAFVPIAGCALAVTIPNVIFGFIVQVLFYFGLRAAESASPDAMAAGAMLAVPIYFLTILVIIAAQAVGQGGIMYAVAEQLSGRSPQLGQALRVALSRAFWVFLTQLICTIAIVVGAVFCFVPGIIDAIFFCVASAVCVVEKVGPIDSISRSIQLTEGQRLMIFVIGLVVTIGYLVIAMCIMMPIQMIVVGGAAAAGGAAALQDPLSFGQILMQIVNIPIQLLFIMVVSTVVAVIYARLRGLRDGVDAQALASVFS